jgi:hypothetical protein
VEIDPLPSKAVDQVVACDRALRSALKTRSRSGDTARYIRFGAILTRRNRLSWSSSRAQQGADSDDRPLFHLRPAVL